MYKCEKCSCLVDAGEIYGNICIDCIENEKALDIQRTIKKRKISRYFTEQADGQLKLIL